MAHVAIVGGGPAGCSAGLFVAKNGHDATVYDTDGTWMHKAHLFNYLGIESRDGSAFMADAREQATDYGVDIREAEVTDVEHHGERFAVTAAEDTTPADYVVFATGTDRDLPEALGCDLTDEGTVAVDIDMETSVEDVYATGATARAEKWQAIISAGDGAAAALDILSKETGERFHDFDTPDDA